MSKEKATFAELRAMLEEYGKAFRIYFDNNYGYSRFAVDSFEDAYCGWHGHRGFIPPLEAYVEELLDEGVLGDMPDNLKHYFDCAKMARDLSCEGYWEADGHVFRPV